MLRQACAPNPELISYRLASLVSQDSFTVGADAREARMRTISRTDHGGWVSRAIHGSVHAQEPAHLHPPTLPSPSPPLLSSPPLSTLISRGAVTSVM